WSQRNKKTSSIALKCSKHPESRTKRANQRLALASRFACECQLSARCEGRPRERAEGASVATGGRRSLRPCTAPAREGGGRAPPFGGSRQIRVSLQGPESDVVSAIKTQDEKVDFFPCTASPKLHQAANLGPLTL
ncbi:hypothetical protein E2320_007939, partial [Naja naja]